jgi:hypothetical protein
MMMTCQSGNDLFEKDNSPPATSANENRNSQTIIPKTNSDILRRIDGVPSSIFSKASPESKKEDKIKGK